MCVDFEDDFLSNEVLPTIISIISLIFSEKNCLGNITPTPVLRPSRANDFLKTDLELKELTPSHKFITKFFRGIASISIGHIIGHMEMWWGEGKLCVKKLTYICSNTIIMMSD